MIGPHGQSNCWGRQCHQHPRNRRDNPVLIAAVDRFDTQSVERAGQKEPNHCPQSEHPNETHAERSIELTPGGSPGTALSANHSPTAKPAAATDDGNDQSSVGLV